MSSSYLVNRIETGFPDDMDWSHALWQKAGIIAIDHFHPQSSDHHPTTHARLLYDRNHLFLTFEVNDRYVVSKATKYQQSVCGDSCVEFFVQPKIGKGYFNFEINCGGTLHLSYIENPARVAHGFARATRVSLQSAAGITIRHSMPPVTTPERPGPITWQISCQIPFSLFEEFVGPLGPISGSEWRANFYKCADHSSHPHWASWAPIGQELNFHQPGYFGQILFA